MPSHNMVPEHESLPYPVRSASETTDRLCSPRTKWRSSIFPVFATSFSLSSVLWRDVARLDEPLAVDPYEFVHATAGSGDSQWCFLSCSTEHGQVVGVYS